MKWLILVFGIAANASASVLVKVAVTPPYAFPSIADPWGALANIPFWAGLALYGLTFLLYAAALTHLPLSVAHPVLTSGAVATVAVLSVAVFREQMPISTLGGLVCVALGVALITARV